MRRSVKGGFAAGVMAGAVACGLAAMAGWARMDDKPGAGGSAGAPAGGQAGGQAEKDGGGRTGAPGAGARTAVRMPGTEGKYAYLESRAGEWDVTATFWLMPGAEGQTTTCTCRAQMVLGGMFLEERLEGGSIGQAAGRLPFSTISHTGYDPGEKRFQVNRMSSTSPVMMPESGQYDEATKTLETTGEFSMMYIKMKVRTVGRTVSEDERVIEQYLSFNGAPEFKGIELKFKRRKA